MVEKRLLEAIDACRPGSEDLRLAELADAAAQVNDDPHLAQVYQQVQTLDGKIARAMEDVEVPSGLADRLLAGLRARCAPDEPTEVALRIEPVRRSSRRFWTMAGGVGAVAAALLLAAWLVVWRQSEEPLNSANLEQLAAEWHEQVWSQDQWRPLQTAARKYPHSDRLRVRPVRWQAFDASADSSAVAYDLSVPGTRATLLVLRARVPGVGGIPPKPFWTLGRSIGAWQSAGLLYVLVVEGPPDRYFRFVNTEPVPLA